MSATEPDTFLDILAIAPHPDDAELWCGGFLALASTLGYKTGILDLTRGEMSSRGTVETRKQEATAAANVLGLAWRGNAEIPDNQLGNTPQNQQRILEFVQKLRPQLCLVSAEHDRHPDHGMAHRLALDSLFYAGLSKRASGLSAWRPKHILLYAHDWPVEPDLVIDISSVFAQKLDAIGAYKTQFRASATDKEPQTPISSERFFATLEARARLAGHRIGVEFGEAYQYYGGPVPVKDISWLMEKRG